ncbi:hypothetical protein GTP81_19270 [Rugamonas sp. FT107W]|uniref:SMODS and SLOG-associating 2TM effector domain-containing protein n=1 Tax=Duganella vulcania TaxID=2692166 RepID=A0A845HN78_9BURK|nr:hypothetical protein [Duganella vulcania]MYN18893.1 hypothetical protein [Duganella vulcania]
MELDKEQLQIELRYAQRFCQRSERFYRRIQTTFTFMSLLAGSSTIAAVSAQMPVAATWMLAAFAIFGILNYAIRPAERIAAFHADVRKYAALIAKSDLLDALAIQHLLHEARQTDAEEIEPLRAVAYNDVMLEIDEPDSLIELSPMQKLMGVLA